MNELKQVVDFIGALEKPVIQLYFTRKTKNGYTTYAPNVSSDIIDDIIELAKNNIINKIDDEVVEFSPISYIDGTIEKCDISYVGNYEEVLRSFRTPDYVDTSLNPEDLTFYCLTISNRLNGERCSLFRRVAKFRKLYAKGIMAWFSGGKLNRMEKPMLGLDGMIDVIEYKGIMYVLNHIALERIFRLNEKISNKATEALAILKEANRIENFDQFEEDCLNDQRYHKTLARMLEENENIAQAFEAFENIKQVIDMFELDIEILESDTPKILYSDKKQRMDILRIINDAYYRSIIRNRQGIDEIR